MSLLPKDVLFWRNGEQHKRTEDKNIKERTTHADEALSAACVASDELIVRFVVGRESAITGVVVQMNRTMIVRAAVNERRAGPMASRRSRLQVIGENPMTDESCTGERSIQMGFSNSPSEEIEAVANLWANHVRSTRTAEHATGDIFSRAIFPY